jgi:hypothetical protein
MGISSRVLSLVKKAVGVSTPAAFPIFGILPTATGQTVTAISAMRVPAVACAVSLISETIGNLPVKLFDRETCQRQSKSEPKGSAKCCHFGVGEIAA